MVKVADSKGNPVGSTAVTFAVTSGGGNLTSGVTQLVVNTDGSGLASTALTLGTNPGSNSVTASAAGLSGSPATFNEIGQLQYDVNVSPTAVIFGDVPITTSAKRTITITSTGQSALTVNSIVLSGSFFALGNLPALPLSLSPSGAVSFDVIYTPLGTLSSSALITVTSNAGSSPTVVQVTGKGTPPPLPPATSITVTTDKPVYHRGQPVQISGTLSAVGGTGISNIPVNVQISINGTIRNLTAYTDALGTYRAVFQPTANDGGAFVATTVGTSGGSTGAGGSTGMGRALNRAIPRRGKLSGVGAPRVPRKSKKRFRPAAPQSIVGLRSRLRFASQRSSDSRNN